MDYKLMQNRGALREFIENIPKRRATPPFDEPLLLRSLASKQVDLSLAKLFPQDFLRNRCVFPLALLDHGNTLVVAAIDPSDVHLADSLAFAVNKNIHLIKAPRAHLQAALAMLEKTPSVDSMLAETIPSPMLWASMDSDFELTLDSQDDMDDDEYSKDSSRPIFSATIPHQAITQSAAFPRPRSGGGVWRGGNNPAKPLPNLHQGGDSLFFYVVHDGQRVLMYKPNGKIEVVMGPRRVWRGYNRFEAMQHFVAHPGEFLITRYRDGRQRHWTGPAEIWLDPRELVSVTKEDALQLAAKEAVVVYSKPAESEKISRRLVFGPALFVPEPGEWLHTFTWHSARGGSHGAPKVAKGLVFQKLWLMPDQMYHDVHDVRTSDDAVLTIRLMLFFELLDIEKMLDTTHDPIGDFVNAATSDVVEFIGKHDFESFKRNTNKLNELDAYRQLLERAGQCGYRINKVVYRGYGAPQSLQQMHDQAIEARTKLQLERATEQQAQDLENYKLDCQIQRASKRRNEQTSEIDHDLMLARKREEAELEKQQSRQEFARTQKQLSAHLDQNLRQQQDTQQREHLHALREMGVDLTALLTQGRADRVIELRGAQATHVHLEQDTPPKT